MATRQYIGARYVPKFDGVHDSTKAYEPLTIVTDVNESSSYTSKKFVPIGIELNNTEYWALTGTLSGAVLDLQNRMAIAENDIDVLNDNVSRVDDMVKNNFTLNPSDHYYVFLGDSYNYQYGGWLPLLADKMGIDSTHYYDYTVSGHGLFDNYWLSDITRFMQDHAEIAEKITDVIIVGGVNDSSPSALSQILTNASALLTYINTNLPHAITSVAFVGSARTNSSVLYDRTFENRMRALNLYKVAFSTKKSRLLTGCENTLAQYTLFGDDGLHPNYSGVQAIAESVYNAYMTGHFEQIIVDTINNTSEFYNTRCITSGDTVKLEIEQIVLQPGTRIAIDAPFEITMPNTCSKKTFAATCAMLGDYATPHFVNVSVVDGVMKISPAMAASSSSYEVITLSGVGRIANIKLVDYTNNQ